jgi:hypothetical protein
MEKSDLDPKLLQAAAYELDTPPHLGLSKDSHGSPPAGTDGQYEAAGILRIY